MSVKDSESRRFAPEIGPSFSQVDAGPTSAPDLFFFSGFFKSLELFFFLNVPIGSSVPKYFWRVSLKFYLSFDTSLSHWHRFETDDNGNAKFEKKLSEYIRFKETAEDVFVPPLRDEREDVLVSFFSASHGCRWRNVFFRL